MIFLRCFNSRARKGRDVTSSRFSPHGGVSIHAPVKGATAWHPQISGYFLVSIHAPVKGATYRFINKRGDGVFQFTRPVKGATIRAPPHVLPTPGFNSRARKGRDARACPNIGI